MIVLTISALRLHTFVKTLVSAALCLALALVLPFLTGQLPQIGAALCPMHLPVLLCGFLCGGPLAALVGFLAPGLRFALFGMPPFPTNLAMAFELAAYGLVAGLLYARLPKRRSSVYLCLLTAMVAGRLVWGVARALLSGVFGAPLTLALFWTSAFASSLPGIVCHLLLIPVLVLALQRARLL